MPLDPARLDLLREVFSIGVGRAASTLNEMLDAHVQLELPSLRVCRVADFSEGLTHVAGVPPRRVSLGFEGPFSGRSGLIMSGTDELSFVAALAGDTADAAVVDAIREGALIEVGNIVLNAILGSIANTLGAHFEYAVPELVDATIENLLSTRTTASDLEILVADTCVHLNLLEIEIVLVLGLSVEELGIALDSELVSR